MIITYSSSFILVCVYSSVILTKTPSILVSYYLLCFFYTSVRLLICDPDKKTLSILVSYYSSIILVCVYSSVILVCVGTIFCLVTFATPFNYWTNILDPFWFSMASLFLGTMD